MATLKALKTRVQAVQSTRKITSAMYMVAAAKFRRAQKHYDTAKSYACALTDIIKALPLSVFDDSNNPLVATKTIGKTFIFLIAADRGLCGSFNSQLFRKTKEACSKLQSANKPFFIHPIGKKAFEYVNTYYPSHLKVKAPIVLHEAAYTDIQSLLSHLENTFVKDNIEQCLMLYNQYNSPLQQTPQQTTLLPMRQVLKELQTPQDVVQPYIPEFISSESVFLNSFLQQYLQGTLWSIITQTLAGEFAARMTAMDNATKNCDDMIHSLKLQYNQNRQARITNELIEIISGAEALQKG